MQDYYTIFLRIPEKDLEMLLISGAGPESNATDQPQRHDFLTFLNLKVNMLYVSKGDIRQECLPDQEFSGERTTVCSIHACLKESIKLQPTSQFSGWR